jgi:hypothetical protein
MLSKKLSDEEIFLNALEGKIYRWSRDISELSSQKCVTYEDVNKAVSQYGLIYCEVFIEGIWCDIGSRMSYERGKWP